MVGSLGFPLLPLDQLRGNATWAAADCDGNGHASITLIPEQIQHCSPSRAK